MLSYKGLVSIPDHDPPPAPTTAVSDLHQLGQPSPKNVETTIHFLTEPDDPSPMIRLLWVSNRMQSGD